MTIPDEIVVLALKEDGAIEPEWMLEMRARPSRGVHLDNQRRIGLRRNVPVFLLRRRYRLRLWRCADTVGAGVDEAPDPQLTYVADAHDPQHRFAVDRGPIGYAALIFQNRFEITAAAVFSFPKSAHLATFEIALGPRVLRTPPFAVAFPDQRPHAVRRDS